jgi:hypothetical protein
VDASTKALQCMATVCSCLKYFGHVVIGVVRPEDKVIINNMVSYCEVAQKELLSLPDIES